MVLLGKTALQGQTGKSRWGWGCGWEVSNGGFLKRTQGSARGPGTSPGLPGAPPEPLQSGAPQDPRKPLTRGEVDVTPTDRPHSPGPQSGSCTPAGVGRHSGLRLDFRSSQVADGPDFSPSAPSPLQPGIKEPASTGNLLLSAPEPWSSQKAPRPPRPDSARPRTQIYTAGAAEKRSPPRALPPPLVSARASRSTLRPTPWRGRG